jgi:RNA polymerase sigma factor (sigma-70 family)
VGFDTLTGMQHTIGLEFIRAPIDNLCSSRTLQADRMTLAPGEQSAIREYPAVAPTEESAIALVPRIRMLLLRWSGDLELAKDLTQDVVMGIVQAIRCGRIDSASALPAYAHKSAKNALLMSARKRSPEFTDALPDVSPAWGNTPATPLEACERDELRSMAAAALEGLSVERDRELIRGFYAEGRSKPELMEEFALTKDQFDRVISRARSRMREQIRQKYLNSRRQTSSMGANVAAGPCSDGELP